MQPNCMLCLLGLFAGSVLGAPADVQPAADKGVSVPSAAAISPVADPATADPDAAIKAAEDSLKHVKDSLRDALSAILAPAAIAERENKAAEAPSVTLPAISIKPVEVTANKRYAEIIGQFIADIIQIPIVLLHAFGEAIAGLTGSKQPLLVYPGSSTSTGTGTAVVESPASLKAEGASIQKMITTNN